jgi:hypothetical protein
MSCEEPVHVPLTLRPLSAATVINLRRKILTFIAVENELAGNAVFFAFVVIAFERTFHQTPKISSFEEAKDHDV